MTDLVVRRKKLSIPMEVVVPKILELGMASAPYEACGVIVPRLADPPQEWVKELRNRSSTPESSYEIDPETIRSLLDDPGVWEDVLIWHTHPSGMVGPSRGDMHARIEGLTYLVVSIPNGEAVMF